MAAKKSTPKAATPPATPAAARPPAPRRTRKPVASPSQIRQGSGDRPAIPTSEESDVKRAKSLVTPYQTCAGCYGPITYTKGFKVSSSRGFCGHCERAARVFQRNTKIKVGPISHQQMLGEFSSHNLEIDPNEVRNVAASHASELEKLEKELSGRGDVLVTGQVERRGFSTQVQLSHLRHWVRLHPVLANRSVEENEQKKAGVKRARLDRQLERERGNRAAAREARKEKLFTAAGAVDIPLSPRQKRERAKKGEVVTVDYTPEVNRGGRPRGAAAPSSEVEKKVKKGVSHYEATSGAYKTPTSSTVEAPLSMKERYPKVVENMENEDAVKRNEVHELDVDDVVYNGRDGFGLVIGHDIPPMTASDARDEASIRRRRKRVHIYYPHLSSKIPYEINAGEVFNVPGIALGTNPDADSKDTPYKVVKRSITKKAEVGKIRNELRENLAKHVAGEMGRLEEQRKAERERTRLQEEEDARLRTEWESKQRKRS